MEKNYTICQRQTFYIKGIDNRCTSNNKQEVVQDHITMNCVRIKWKPTVPPEKKTKFFLAHPRKKSEHQAEAYLSYACNLYDSGRYRCRYVTLTLEREKRSTELSIPKKETDIKTFY